jgi:predicted double-glycine peptidase
MEAQEIRRYGVAILVGAIMVLSSIPPVKAGSATIPGADADTISVPVMSLKELKFRTIVRQQYDYSCGSAAVATLLTFHYQDPVTEQQAFTAMWVDGDQAKIRKEGFSLLDIKHYLEREGYRANGYEASLDQLIKAAIPAIVLIRDHGYNHFVVIKGIKDNKVLVGDPALGSRVIPRKKFEGMLLNRILFVIDNAQTSAAFNTAREWRVRADAPLGIALTHPDLLNTTLLRAGPNDYR